MDIKYCTFVKCDKTYFPSKITIPEPPRYKIDRADAIKICVKGSVEGVIMAANIVEPTSVYFQMLSILCPEKTPNKPNIT